MEAEFTELSSNVTSSQIQQKQKKKHDTCECRFMNEHNATATEQLIEKTILAAPEQQSKQSDTKLQITFSDIHILCVLP